MYFQRPSLALVLAARGAGKSFLSALHTHLLSRWNPGHATRVLGGSRAQSLQVYRALCDLVRDGRGPLGYSDADSIRELLKGEARYRNGSEVAILAASSTSVRGPHVPSLKLDEIDEIDPECREAAMGMCMERRGCPASVLMTSTWHRLDGPMAEMIDQARAGAFPLYTFCTFEVLEHCSDERSGADLERCGECPLKKHCHNVADGGPPKGKRSHGHYAIDSLIQKLRSTSARTFQAEYLCLGPKADGLWFPDFAPEVHVSMNAEYNPAWPVHLALDSGVFTGAVFFQVLRPAGATEEIHVFADYLAESLSAETNARALLEFARHPLQWPRRSRLDRSGRRRAESGRADRDRRVRAGRAATLAPLAVRLGGRRPGPGRVVPAPGRRSHPAVLPPALHGHHPGLRRLSPRPPRRPVAGLSRRPPAPPRGSRGRAAGRPAHLLPRGTRRDAILPPDAGSTNFLEYDLKTKTIL